jgi:hypothetical protein
MRNLNNKNNCFSVYKCYRLNTLMTIAKNITGERINDVYQEKNLGVIDTIKRLTSEEYSVLNIENEDGSATALNLDNIAGGGDDCITLICQDQGFSTRIKHCNILVGDFIEVESTTWFMNRHVGVFQGVVILDSKDEYISYLYPSKQTHHAQRGFLPCSTVSALTEEDNLTLYLVPISYFVTARTIKVATADCASVFSVYY